MTRYRWLKKKIVELRRCPMLPNECLIWPFAINWTGHGNISIRKRDGNLTTLKAHRKAYEWYYDRKPKGNVCHTCDNPACYNPAHLYDGSQKQNMADKVKRGETGFCGPKLTITQVKAIYSLAHSGNVTQQEIADLFGISIPTVSMIKNGKTRSKITQELSIKEDSQ